MDLRREVHRRRFSALAGHPAGHRPRGRAQGRASKPTILAVALFYLIITLGYIGSQYTGISVVYLVPACTSAAFVILLLVVQGREARLRTGAPRVAVLVIFLGLALCSTFVPLVRSMDNLTLLRTLYLPVFILGLAFVFTRVRSTDLRLGLLLYSGCDLLILLFTWDQWKPNALASRSVVDCTVFLFLSTGKFQRIGPLSLLLVLIVICGSRTVHLSFCAATIIVLLVRNRLLDWRILAVTLCFGSVVSLILVSNSSELLNYFLESESLVGKYLLKGKRPEEVFEDPLNRKFIWELAVSGIRANPWVGYGAGQENRVTGELRAHSAYLTLALQFGIPAASFWVLFYCTAFFHLMVEYGRTSASLALFGIFLIAYMLVSGIFESSGLGSLIAPNNLVALAIVFRFISLEVTVTRRPYLYGRRIGEGYRGGRIGTNLRKM